MLRLSIAIFLLFLVQLGCSYRFGLARSYSKALRMVAANAGAGAGSAEAIAGIRAKMEADPNYNPMTDPQAASIIDEILPDCLKELPNALERLNVALKDATTSVDSEDEIDTFAASIPDKRELISSPQSDFFKNGMKVEGDEPDFDELDKALQMLRKKFPQVPLEE